MGHEELKNRENWQTKSGEKAIVAEDNFKKVFEQHFEGSKYRVRLYPNEFKTIYMNVKLEQSILESIYSPVKPYRRHGIIPDFAIDNLETKKSIYGDCKQQDGWVEGKPPSAGRGNAHERACRYFTPGLLKDLRSFGNIDVEYLPFWIVLQGDITRDPKRVREIHHWFSDCIDHFFLWIDPEQSEELIKHFYEKLKHILD